MTGVKGDRRQYSHPIVIKALSNDGSSWLDNATRQRIFISLTSKPELDITRVLLDVSDECVSNTSRYYVGIRAVESVNAMTARCMDLNVKTIQNIIHDVKEATGIGAVLFDIGNKPCETIEPE